MAAVKNLVLSLLRLGFDPWLRKFCMLVGGGGEQLKFVWVRGWVVGWIGGGGGLGGGGGGGG